jgi:hypothetical protein
MPLKKATAPGAALQPLDTNQDTLSLREARSQKRKATSPTLHEEELDQEIRDLEVIHQQVRGRRKKCFGWPTFRGRLTKQLRKCIISLRMTKTEGPNTKQLRKCIISINEDEWYDNFHHGNFAFDDASPLAAEL